MTPGMMVGAALFFAGVLTILVLFALERSLAKSQQLSAIGRLASGKAGGGRRVAFFLALGCLFFGACSLFASVSAKDKARRDACVRTCKDKGYDRGSIRASSKKPEPDQPKRPPAPACVCEGGGQAEPLELDADKL